MSDRAFICLSTNVMLGLIKIRKREGKDVTEHMQALSKGEIEKLCGSGEFNLKKSETLQDKVFWDVRLNFGRWGQERLHDFKSNSYVKCTHDVGHKSYTMTHNDAN